MAGQPNHPEPTDSTPRQPGRIAGIVDQAIAAALGALLTLGVLGLLTWLDVIGGIRSVLVPTGAVVAFNGPCPEDGWDPFREGTGRFLIGAGNNYQPQYATWTLNHADGSTETQTLTVRELMKAGGAEEHVLLINEMPNHTHQGNNVRTTAASAESGGTNSLHPWDSSQEGVIAAEGVNYAGGGQAHNNMPPYIPLNFCIRVG